MLSSRYAKMLCRLAEHPYFYPCRQGSTTLDSVVYNDTTILAKKQPHNIVAAKIVWFYHFLTQRKGWHFTIRAAPVLVFSPSVETVILWYSNPFFICSSPQKNVDFLANLSYHTTNLGAPQKRRTPCCISLLQQGGFHTTGILQTNRNTWIQGTRKTFKSSESYTISQKSLLIT